MLETQTQTQTQTQTKADDSAIMRMIQTAHKAGCPRDQVERLLSYGYIPLPWQWSFHSACREADNPEGPVYIGAGGARGPGKSHASLAQVVLDDSIRAPGLKTLFLRNTGKAARESFSDLITRVLAGRIDYQYNRSDNVLYLPNQSRVVLGGYHTEGDIDSYVGIEYDQIVIEEMTQLSEGKVTPLLGSLRTSRSDWRPRLICTTNPGGIGHLYFKNTFVVPFRDGKQTKTRFIPSTYRDNPYLNREYVEYLEGLTGDLGRAWRDGDWDVYEGQAFPLWRDDLHVIQPREIPASWVRVVGIDWGYAAPFVCLWGAKDPDTGRIYIYRELVQTDLTDIQQARSIAEFSRDEYIRARYADPSMWTKRTVDEYARSTADVYQVEGVPLTKGDNDRLSGKRKVDRLLGMLPDGKPGLQVFSTCKILRETLPALPYDKYKVEDVDTKADDHAYDALRYLLTDIDQRPVPKKEYKQQENPLRKLRHI